MAGRQLTLEQALHCAKCGTVAKTAQEHESRNYKAGEIILIECPAGGCKEISWFYCKSCKKRAYRNNLSKHHTRKKHLSCHEEAYLWKIPAPHPTAESTAVEQDASKRLSMPFPEAPSPMGDVDGSSVVTAAMETSKINYKEIENDLANTYMENAEGPMEEIPVLPTGKTSQFPLINMNGNEWLKHALKHVPYATINDLQQCFADSDLKGMKDFWIAELMSGPGRCGGGLCYLSTRAFQQTTTQHHDEQRLHDFEESHWQFDYMLQYQSTCFSTSP